MISKHFQKVEHHINNRSRIRMHDVLKMIEDDSILVILAILSVLNIILAPLPVNSFILGIPLMGFSVAFIIEMDMKAQNHKWLRRPLKCAKWRNYLPHSRAIFTKIDRYTYPRLPFLLSRKYRMLAGISLLFLSIVIFLPIPFANTPGSAGMLLIAVGLLQKDGLFVACGYFITIIHLIGIALLVFFINSGIFNLPERYAFFA